MTLPAYFLSPEWALIATQLLVAMTLLVLFLAAAIWRRNRRARRAIQRLLADRNAIRQAGEHVLDRLPEHQRPDDASRVDWVDRSLELLEPLASAWLEADRHGPEDVMRRLLVIRQEDLHQRLTEPSSPRSNGQPADRLPRNERERTGPTHPPAASDPNETRDTADAPDPKAPRSMDPDNPA